MSHASPFPPSAAEFSTSGAPRSPTGSFGDTTVPVGTRPSTVEIGHHPARFLDDGAQRRVVPQLPALLHRCTKPPRRHRKRGRYHMLLTSYVHR